LKKKRKENYPFPHTLQTLPKKKGIFCTTVGKKHEKGGGKKKGLNEKKD